MRTIVKSEIFKWAILSALLMIGTIAFMVLAGEDDPMKPLPLSRWLLMKAVAGLVLYACYIFGRILYRLGLLPEYVDRMANEEE